MPPEQRSAYKQEAERWHAVVRKAFSEDERARRMRRDCLAWSHRFDWDRATDDLELAIEVAIRGNPT